MTQNIHLSLMPANNTRLANLCGVSDENIVHIARALSVTIKRRGEQFLLCGESAPQAAEVLRVLYQQADKGIIVGDDVRVQLGAPAGAAELPPARRDRYAPPPAAITSAGMPAAKKTVWRSDSQRVYYEKILNNSIVLCLGPAGTGKTHVAVAGALKMMGARGGRLVLSRPVIEAGGERLGFLPGDMEQKVHPYLRPLYDILHQLLGSHEVERRLSRGEIEIIPLAFLRGVTLNNMIFLLDEAQNITPAQMKMLLTRIGEGSTIIAAGDPSQSDISGGGGSSGGRQPCGLSDAAARLAGVDGIAVHRFSEGDIVRHPLLSVILKKYANV